MEQISFFEIAISIVAAVILFTHALKGFGKDVQRVGGRRLEFLLAGLTRRRSVGFLLGAGLTALIQSSSAVSGLTVALVEAGTITFRNSLSVFLGANVGTTMTAWLVAFDATILGPFLIVLSAVATVLPGRISLFGRSILYLGIILLALQLIGDYVAPLKDVPEMAGWLALAENPLVGLLVGIVATSLLQSSSVVIGLSIIAVQQGLLGTEQVIPIVIGSNIGTTSTALFASISMGEVARRAATANLLFNVVGVLAFLPFMSSFSRMIVELIDQGDMAVAVTHLVFNLCVALLGFALLNPIAQRLAPTDRKSSSE